jgi:1,4-dihydroxy-2-naphthoate polyprenyltransferase
MQSQDSNNQDDMPSPSKVKAIYSSQIVTPDSVQAEEDPTIPLGSLQTLSTLQPEVSIHSVASTRSVSMPAPLVVQPSEYRRSLGEWLSVWWDGMRPSYLPLSIMPVVVGSVLAWTQSIAGKSLLGHFHVLRFLATLIAVILLQIGAHLVNDYYDYLKGIDTSNSLGPGGLIQQGLIKPSRVLSFGLVLLAFGALVGVLVAISGGLLVFVFGLIGLLAAYLYSATSRALSSMALGELVSFLIFGPCITLGAYIVQTGHTDRLVLLYSIPLGLLATAVIHLNNMRDTESDLQAGKHTLASLWGLRMNRAFYVILLLGVYATIVALAVPHHAPHLVLLTLWTLPTAIVAMTGVLRTDAPAGLHLAMHKTLRVEVYFTLWLVVALFVSALWPLLPHLHLPF